ncbi:hypothetical protein JCM16303_005257 [Sporobolomyces ruberrimus]
MSRLATRRTQEDYEAAVYIPVASTSAVRLDSPFPTGFPPTSTASVYSKRSPATAPPAITDNSDQPLADLPSVLRKIQSLSLEHPDKTPAEIISQARQKAYEGDSKRSAPIPPPPIVLHPQPYSSDSRFFTPLLLQAMILGASALGLLTRRKVGASERGRMAEARSKGKTAREEAEERIDEVQALNLLISVHAVHEAQPCQQEEPNWRTSAMRTIVKLLSRADQTEQTLDRLGIAAILHFIAPTLTAHLSYQQARPLLATRLHEAYRALPRPDRESSDLPLDVVTLSCFLSLIYPRDGKTTPKLSSTSSQGSSLDRSILETAANRILASPTDFPPELVYQLGKAAARAKRLDIFDDVSKLAKRCSSTLRLDLAVTGLDLLASESHWRNDRTKVLPLAQSFSLAVETVRSIDKEGIDRLDRGLYLLRTAFAIDRPLEPLITQAVLSTLSNGTFDFGSKRCRTLLVDTLKHLCKSRNPTLARQILSSIPPERLRISHLSPLLSNSHPVTSQTIWDMLLSHPSLPLTVPAVSARFTSLSHRSAPPTILDTARRDFQLIEQRGITPSMEIWNKYLHVVVRFGGDRAVQNVLASMESAGIERNEWTRTILLQREIVRRDVQTRTIREGRDDEREKPRSARPVVETVRVNRRGGGRAQMRKLKEAIREEQARKGADGKGKKTIDIGPNLLLKNFTRWTVECDTTRLLQLTKVVVGVDLESQGVPPIVNSQVVQSMSKEEYEKVRIPAFRTLISAFERRGEAALAKELRRSFRQEQEEIKDARRL